MFLKYENVTIKTMGDMKAQKETSEYVETEEYTSMSLSAAKERRKMQFTPEESKRQTAVMEALEKTSQELVIETDIQLILERIAETLGVSLGAKYVNFWGFSPDKKGVSITAAYGMQQQYIEYSRIDPLPLGTAWIGRAMKTRQAWSTSNVQKDPYLPASWLPAVKKQAYHGLLCTPLVRGEKAIGGMCIYYEDMHGFDYFEMSVATIVANQAATAVENARIFGDLTTEKNKTTSIIYSLNDGLIMYDNENRIVFFNPKAQEFLLVGLREVIGKKQEEILPQSNIYLENLHRISLLVTADYETKEYTTDGPQKLILRVTQIPVNDTENKKIGVMHVLHNITREKEVEQLKASFVTVASHQLRTPLAGIKWTLDAFLKEEYGPLNQKQQELVKKVFGTNEHLINLINDLLDVSRIEEGKFGYTFTPGDVAEIVEKITKNLQTNAQAKNVALAFKRPEQPSPRTVVDASKLELAIQNLVDNAIKYSKPGGRVIVELREEGGFFLVIVTDNGIGIPEEDRAFVFNKFFRAKNAILYQTEGSGLGLFIAKSIVEKHNGTLTFTSKENDETTFAVHLPLDPQKMPRGDATKGL